jgi:hypothetical protein
MSPHFQNGHSIRPKRRLLSVCMNGNIYGRTWNPNLVKIFRVVKRFKGGLTGRHTYTRRAYFCSSGRAVGLWHCHAVLGYTHFKLWIIWAHFTKFDVNIRPMPKEATPISYCEFSKLEDNIVVGTTTFIQRKTSKWRLREIEIQFLV